MAALRRSRRNVHGAASGILGSNQALTAKPPARGRLLCQRRVEDADGRGGLENRYAIICSIPDDHIDPRRSAFFIARSVLRDIRENVQC